MDVPRVKLQGVLIVKKSKSFVTRWAAVVVGAACLAGVAVQAQAQAQAPRMPAPLGVRVIDLKRIFDKHERFKAATEILKREVTAREEQLKASRQGMEQNANTLKTLKQGTPEYARIEAELIRADSELKAQLNIGRREFLDKEAKIYLDVYSEVIEEVKYYCQVQGVSLVMRYNGEPADGQKDPQEVLKELNKSIIYYHPSLDVSDLIVNELNRRWMGSQGRPATPTANNTRPAGATR